jgi:hypothetical protein
MEGDVSTVLLIITLTGPDANAVAAEIGQELEDQRDSGEFEFSWSTDILEVREPGTKLEHVVSQDGGTT